MKRPVGIDLQIFLATAFAALGLVAPAWAQNPEHVQRLLKTNQCLKCDLRGADLAGANLIKADLRGSQLQGAKLIFANLAGANLSDANLEAADLSYANLVAANFSSARLQQTRLIGANLVEANFSKAHLTGADLTSANRVGAIDLNVPDLKLPTEKQLPSGKFLPPNRSIFDGTRGGAPNGGGRPVVAPFNPPPKGAPKQTVGAATRLLEVPTPVLAP